MISRWPQNVPAGQVSEQTAKTRIHTYIENRLGGAKLLSGDWKLVWWKENGQYVDPMLFNLAVDSMETTDLAALRPTLSLS
tara:strand:+ start:18770 stop:19012 length:243 start_codon:yes stop_codon:yes gene_type:complete